MEEGKRKAIQELVDSNMYAFARGLCEKHIGDMDDPDGVINKKKNNAFMAELGSEFMFYSALVRSFDSSFGNVLEKLGNSIAKLSYDVRNKIDSFLLPAQETKIAELINAYSADADRRVEPSVDHYRNYACILPRDLTSFKTEHVTDHYFYDKEKDAHYLIELKAGGDLDKKKAPSEKSELLKEYFLLKNALLKEGRTANVFLYFAAAYNKDGEGNYWKQNFVRNCFAEEELLIGRDYWNFVCNDESGFEIVMEQYKKSAEKIKAALFDIKRSYFPFL